MNTILEAYNRHITRQRIAEAYSRCCVPLVDPRQSSGDNRARYDHKSSEQERWVTINGTHVKIGGSGEVVAPPALKAKIPAKPSKPNQAKPAAPQKVLFPEASQGQRLMFGPEDVGKIGTPRPKALPGWAEHVAKSLSKPAEQKGPSTPSVGPATHNVNDLHVDPDRFQYKLNTTGAHGVTDQFSDIKFNPEIAGSIHVWHDPADGKTYVINGHHRYDLAKRSGYAGKLQTYHLEAKDAQEARAKGALINIAGGNGTAIDAAKFMRDTGSTAEEMQRHGVSLKGAVARDAVPLAGLSGNIFRRLTIGTYSQGRALAIGRHLPNTEDQDRLDRIIEKAEAGGRDLSDSTVEEMARDAAMAARQTKTTRSLFGEETEDRPLIIERAELKGSLRRELTGRLNKFRAVSTDRAAETLKGSNQISAEKNKAEADRLASFLEDFDRETSYKGPVSDRLNQAAQELADAPRRKKQILDALGDDIRRIIESGATPVPGNDSAGAGSDVQGRGEGDQGLDPVPYKPIPGQKGMFSQRERDRLNGRGRDVGGLTSLVLRAYYELTGDRATYAKHTPGKGQKSLFGGDSGEQPKDPEFERKHPRDHGKFAPKGEGDSGATDEKPKDSKPDPKIEAKAEPVAKAASKPDSKATPPQAPDLKHQILKRLMSGGETFTSLRTGLKQTRHNPEDPLSHPFNKALRELHDEGSLTATTPPWGEPSFLMNDAQKSAARKLLEAYENAQKSGEPEKPEPVDHPAPKPDQVAEPGKAPERPAATDTPEPPPPEKGPTAAEPVNNPNIETEDNSRPNPIETESPREAAAKESQRQLDANYAFARASAVPNAGEDLLGSARHRANAWTTLEAAEKDGSAAEMVTRDNLLKNEPHGLLAIVEPPTALSSLAMHLAMQKFPSKPFDNEHSYYRRQTDEQKAKHRANYVEAYRAIKADAESIAKSETDPMRALKALSGKILEHINRIRASGERYDPVANGLAGMYSNTVMGPYGGRGKLHAGTQTMDFAKRLRAKYGDGISRDTLEKAADHVRDIIEGDSFNKTFGTKGEKKGDSFNPADLYVKHAVRTGGRDVPKDTTAATKHILEKLKMRGVQWGNYVTDDERQHHLTHVAGAFADLADVMGLRPEDMSLDGTLGLAIGARGRAGALAHYEPDTKVINLTRKGGVGALAHEWGHMFDHSLTGYKHYRSGQSMHGPEGPDDPLHKAYRGLAKAMASSGFERRMKDAVQSHVRAGMSTKKGQYWTSPHEVFARAFESHVDHVLRTSGRVNTYLAGMLGHDFWPTKEESAALAPHFDAIAAAYREKKYGSPERQSYSREAMMRHMLGQFETAMYARKPAPGQKSLFGDDGDAGSGGSGGQSKDPDFEKKHPRDHGKFTEKGAGDAGGSSGMSAEKTDTEPTEKRQETDKETTPKRQPVTADKHPGNGSIVTDHQGNEYLVMKARHGFVEGAPIQNGKAVVNANSIKQFYVGDKIVGRETDKLFHTGRNYYDEQEQGASSPPPNPHAEVIAQAFAQHAVATPAMAAVPATTAPPRTPEQRILDDDIHAALRQPGSTPVIEAPDNSAALADLMSRHPGLKPVDVGEKFVQSLRAVANEGGIDWSTIERAKSAQKGTQDHANMQIVIGRAMSKLAPQINKTEGASVLHNFGPLKEYGASDVLSQIHGIHGGHDPRQRQHTAIVLLGGDHGQRIPPGRVSKKMGTGANSAASPDAPAPAPTPAPAVPTTPSAKPSVPGAQQSLFGGQQVKPGQQSLFNVAPSSGSGSSRGRSKAPPARDLNARPAGVLDLDALVPKQEESLPGQRALFSLIHQAYDQHAETARYRI